MEKLLYPACFYPSKDKKGVYTVVVPDLPGCVTEGTSLENAIEMANDAAAGWILDELEDNNKIPAASSIKNIKPDSPDGFTSILTLDLDLYAEKYGNKTIRKNLTIPAWLNTFAEKNSINFSKVLQDALLDIFKRKQELSAK